MKELLQKLIGEYNHPLDNNGNYLLGVCGIDYIWICSFILYLVAIIFILKGFFRLIERWKS